MTETIRRNGATRRRVQRLRATLCDIGLGFATFLVILAVVGAPAETWSVSRATAADHLAARAIAATSPPGPGSENAILGAVLHGASPLQAPPRATTILILGLTFTLMFAFNLAIWRHLRRVYASPRRGVWRRGR